MQSIKFSNHSRLLESPKNTTENENKGNRPNSAIFKNYDKSLHEELLNSVYFTSLEKEIGNNQQNVRNPLKVWSAKIKPGAGETTYFSNVKKNNVSADFFERHPQFRNSLEKELLKDIKNY